MKNWIINKFIAWFLKKHTFAVSQVIEDMNGNKFVIEGCFYNERLEPILICMDIDTNQMCSLEDNKIEKVIEEN